MNPARASTLDKIPPQNLEAERAALGAMLLGDEASAEAVSKAMTNLKPEDFYRTSHQRIFAAMRALFEKGEKIDAVTVRDKLEQAGHLEAAGGSAYIGGLVDELPLTSMIEEYTRIVKDKADMRKVVEVGNGLFSRGMEGASSVMDLLNQGTQRLLEIMTQRYAGGMRPIKEYMMATIEKVEKLAARAEREASFLTGLPTGYKKLDEALSGLQNGELVILAARPGMGKTSFALNVAENVATQRRVPVLVFSMEMSSHQLVTRMLCAHARVNSHDVRIGRTFPEDRAKLHHSAGVLNDLPILIDDASRLTPLEIRAKARRVIAEYKAQEAALIIVDYLQLMEIGSDSFGSRSENRQQEITTISRLLKAVAKELNIPVMVLSQLSRASERRERGDKKPRLSDLRESGSIEQDADVVIFLYRDTKEEGEDEQASGMEAGWITKVLIAKQRNGPTGVLELYFNRPFTRFDEVETHFKAEDE